MMTTTADDNEQAPPSSAEEAAALLGAAISFDATSYNAANSNNNSTATAAAAANPPQGMHSIFTVQTPVPNQILFIRLINLRAWFRWHAGIDSSSELGISFPKPPPPKKDEDEDQPPFQAARSILAVLQKLLEISSALAASSEGGGAHENDSGGVGGGMTTIAAAMSPKLGVVGKKSLHSSAKQQPGGGGGGGGGDQHKQLPPLLSTPLRHAWVECTALCLALGSNLPGNLRTDAHSLISKMMEISNWNPRSKMASGGVRLSALMVLGKICVLGGGSNNHDKSKKKDSNVVDLAKRVSPYAHEIISCCHKGLLSGGAGEPGHRVECVNTAWKLAVACRRSHDANRLLHGGNDQDQSSVSSFLATGAMEDRAVIEAIKFIKRATADKYPEVRMGAAVFAGMMAPMLIRNIRSSSSSGTANKDGGSSGIGDGGGGVASAPLDRWEVKCSNMTINWDNRRRHHGSTSPLLLPLLLLLVLLLHYLRFLSYYIFPSIGRMNAISSEFESSHCALSIRTTIEPKDESFVNRLNKIDPSNPNVKLQIQIDIRNRIFQKEKITVRMRPPSPFESSFQSIAQSILTLKAAIRCQMIIGTSKISKRHFMTIR